MPKEQEVLRLGDREVTVTNPGKVFFEAIGRDEARPRPLLPRRRAGRAGRRRRPADGPQALRQRRGGRGVLPEARAGQPAGVAAHGHAVVPVGPDGRRDRRRRGGGPRLDRQPRLHRPEPPPGPRRRPRPSRRAAGRPRSRARASRWSQIRDVAMVTKESLEAVGLVGWPKTSGSRGIHINVRIERRWTYPEVRRAALAIARDVERRAPDIATAKWWKEERHGVFLDYNQNAKDRTVASAYSVRPLPGCARLDARCRGTRSRRARRRRSRSPTVPAAVRRRSAIRVRGSTRRSARSRRCWSCRGSTRPRARATRRGRPTTASRRASRRGSSRRASGARPRSTRRPEAEAEREKNRAAMEKRFLAEAERRAAAKAAGTPIPSKPDPDRPPPLQRAGHRDLAREDEGRGARGPRALEGAPPEGGRAPSRRPTCWSTGCAAAPRSGIGSG